MRKMFGTLVEAFSKAHNVGRIVETRYVLSGTNNGDKRAMYYQAPITVTVEYTIIDIPT